LNTVDSIFAKVASDGTATWFLGDHLGSIRDITSITMVVVDHRDWDAWGNVLTETNSANTDRFGWTSREFDSETGLQYNRAREYGAGVGRWISEDPLRFAGRDLNLYRYTQNSPSSHFDSSGLILYSEVPVQAELVEFRLLDEEGKDAVDFMGESSADITELITTHITIVVKVSVYNPKENKCIHPVELKTVSTHEYPSELVPGAVMWPGGPDSNSTNSNNVLVRPGKTEFIRTKKDYDLNGMYEHTFWARVRDRYFAFKLVMTKEKLGTVSE
jgi:RHS repeat-associated protein